MLYILGDFTQVSGGNGSIGIDGKTVKLTAESNATKFTLPNGTLYPPEGKGVVEFDNITLVRTLTGTNNYDIDLRGFDFVLGENAKVSGQVTINQRWSGDVTLNDQLVDIKGNSAAWPNININIANYDASVVKGTSTVKVANATIENLGPFRDSNGGTSFFGTQNYIIGSTVRNLHFGKSTAQKGKRYVQINAGGVIDGYTTGDATGLTADDFSGVNIIEINSG